jgi:hypothetical protein
MTRPTHSPIIAPDNPGPEVLAQMMQVEVTKVFDGDGFLARVWHPLKNEWVVCYLWPDYFMQRAQRQKNASCCFAAPRPLREPFSLAL